ncbi:hypothetical protein [Mycoplasma simbae]|uniref:hypothetical protein n=1 Tax=Mycoplasma simbae TaxID=36744 RepID=UPI0004971AC1|nr:hypothetical protein [Mycoplasma simbae]
MIDTQFIGITLSEFKQKWFFDQANIKIPLKFKELNPALTEDKFFNILANDIIRTCDLFVENYFTKLQMVGKNNIAATLTDTPRLEAFKSAVYCELSYRITNNSYPDFANRKSYTTNGFSLTNDSNKFITFSDYLNPKSIAFLNLYTWNTDEEAEFSWTHFIVDKFSGLKEEVSLITKTLDAENDLDRESIKARISQVSNKLEEFKNSIPLSALLQLQPQIDTINANASNLSQKQINDINSLSRQINTLQSNFDASTSTLRDKQSELVSELARVKSVDQDQQNEMAQIRLSLQANSQADAETLRRFNELSQEYITKNAELSSSIADVDSRCDDIGHEINDISSDIEIAQSDITEIKSTIANNYANTVTTSNFNTKADTWSNSKGFVTNNNFDAKANTWSNSKGFLTSNNLNSTARTINNWNISVNNPTNNRQVANKAYVDDAINRKASTLASSSSVSSLTSRVATLESNNASQVRKEWTYLSDVLLSENGNAKFNFNSVNNSSALLLRLETKKTSKKPVTSTFTFSKSMLGTEASMIFTMYTGNNPDVSSLTSLAFFKLDSDGRIWHLWNGSLYNNQDQHDYDFIRATLYQLT